MIIAEHIPTVSTGAVIAALVLLGVAGGGGYWMGRATTEPTTETDTVQVGRPGTAGDLPDATMHDLLTQYEAPDTTVTQCMQVPTWLAGQNSSDALTPSDVPKSDTTTSGARSRSVADSLAPHSLNTFSTTAGQAYDIIPTTSGRPVVSVTRHEVRTSTIDPETGAMSTWTWSIERPDNRLSAFAEAGALPGTAYALTGARYERDLGRLDVWGLTLDTQVHAAAGQAWTTRGVGPAIRTGVSIGIMW